MTPPGGRAAAAAAVCGGSSQVIDIAQCGGWVRRSCGGCGGPWQLIDIVQCGGERRCAGVDPPYPHSASRLLGGRRGRGADGGACPDSPLARGS
jgi:hypothetical protein